jgi:hypothetical protein
VGVVVARSVFAPTARDSLTIVGLFEAADHFESSTRMIMTTISTRAYRKWMASVGKNFIYNFFSTSKIGETFGDTVKTQKIKSSKTKLTRNKNDQTKNA